MLLPAEHLSVSIARSPHDVYTFASDPENLPKWAAGLSGAKIHKEGAYWVSESPMGKVKIKFAPKNDFGVMDHEVTVPSGETTNNAFRVLPNANGSEVVFTVFRPAKMSDAEYAKDTKQIRADLESLRKNLEKK